MQTPIVQTLALAIFGNAFLQGRDIGAFWPDGSVFQFCRDVRFVASIPGPLMSVPREVAPDPMTWFQGLRGRVPALLVHVVPRADPNLSDRMSVGFVGGGSRWIIEAVRPGGSSLWEGVWQVGDQNAPDQRIWAVDYHRLATDWQQPLARQRDLVDIREELAEVLTAMAAFCDEHELGWSENFRAGLAALSSDSPLDAAYHKDLAPPGLLSPTALQLLGACQSAWVFGGMGSFNDNFYGEELQPDVDAWGERLFDLMQQALASVANSTAPT